jgi:hypothetical protein
MMGLGEMQSQDVTWIRLVQNRIKLLTFRRHSCVPLILTDVGDF